MKIEIIVLIDPDQREEAEHSPVLYAFLCE